MLLLALCVERQTKASLCRPLSRAQHVLLIRTWGSAALHPRLYAVACSAGFGFYFSKAILSTTTVPFSRMHLSQCTPIEMDVNFLRTSCLRSSGMAHSGWLKESSFSL